MLSAIGISIAYSSIASVRDFTSHQYRNTIVKAIEDLFRRAKKIIYSIIRKKQKIVIPIKRVCAKPLASISVECKSQTKLESRSTNVRDRLRICVTARFV